MDQLGQFHLVVQEQIGHLTFRASCSFNSPMSCVSSSSVNSSAGRFASRCCSATFSSALLRQLSTRRIDGTCPLRARCTPCFAIPSSLVMIFRFPFSLMSEAS